MVYSQSKSHHQKKSQKPPNTNRQYRYRILKSFYRLYKNIQQQNSQRANSIVTNDVFSFIYSYLSILELRETQDDSPTQTSRHTAVRQKISFFSKFLNTIRENLTNNDIS